MQWTGGMMLAAWTRVLFDNLNTTQNGSGDWVWMHTWSYRMSRNVFLDFFFGFFVS